MFFVVDNRASLAHCGRVCWSYASRLAIVSCQALSRKRRAAVVAAGALLAVLLVLLHASYTPPPREITQRDIDGAVLRMPVLHRCTICVSGIDQAQREIVEVRAWRTRGLLGAGLAACVSDMRA